MIRKRVLVADDLAALLQDSFEIVGMVSDGQTVLDDIFLSRMLQGWTLRCLV